MLISVPMVSWYTVDDVVRIYRVRPSYVIKLACVRQWRRYRDVDRRARYNPLDVDAVLGRPEPDHGAPDIAPEIGRR